MPHHTTWLMYVLDWLIGHSALNQNMHAIFGNSAAGKPVGWHAAEPVFMSLIVFLIVGVLAWRARGELGKNTVLPDAKLSVRTFLEVFVSYFYELMRDMMGQARAKRYFPIIGTCAFFIFFSNMIGLLPGVHPPTSTWSITAGCALVVFVAFNYYGIKENGFGYIRHFAGPYMGPVFLPLNAFIFVLEIFSMCLRPITLSFRLMLNMAIDHLLLAVFMGLFPLFVPIPTMLLGTLIALIQTLVFCLLSSIYIGLATEDMHGDDHGAGPEHSPASAAH